jgi:hypothetical protein
VCKQDLRAEDANGCERMQAADDIGDTLVAVGEMNSH